MSQENNISEILKKEISYYKKVYQYNPFTQQTEVLHIPIFFHRPLDKYICKTCLEEFLEEDSDESLSDDQQ